MQTVDDANDLDALEVAIDQAMREEERPSLIRVNSIIGWPSPNKQGTSKAHGSPLGEDEVRLTKEVLGWDPDEHFVVPDEVREHFDQRRARRRAAGRVGRSASGPGATADDELAAAVGRRLGAAAAARRARGAADIDWDKDKLATRSAGQQAMAAFADYVPTMVGGAADLSESTKTEFPGGHELNYKQGRPAATSSSASASTAWAARSTAWPATAASCARTARPSCSSPTTCAARCACRR